MYMARMTGWDWGFRRTRTVVYTGKFVVPRETRSSSPDRKWTGLSDHSNSGRSSDPALFTLEFCGSPYPVVEWVTSYEQGCARLMCRESNLTRL